MRKIILLALLSFTVLACSKDDDSSSSNLFNPPEWITGSWLDQSEPEWQQIGGYKFTNDNILDINSDGDVIANFKESYKNADEAGISIEEIITDTNYEISIVSNGITTLNYKFEKQSDTTIIYNLSTIYDVVLTKQ